MLAAVRWAVARDLRVALRSRAELGVQLLFYVIVVSVFPLASSPDRALLAAMGPGVLWVASLLASLLALPRLFASDFADGTLEQIALSPYPLPALVAGKVLAHWLTTGLPAGGARADPRGAIRARRADAGDRHASLLIGTPILSLLGGIGAALTLGTRGGGSLLALLILPLYVPVLIFGAGCGGCVACRAVRCAQSFAARRGAADHARRRAVRHGRGGAHRARLMQVSVYQFSSPATFYHSRDARAVVRGRGGGARRRRPLDRLRDRAHRFPAGRGIPHHLHPRAVRMDVDVHLSRDGVLEHRRA